ncbi:MAG: phenylalanine 4-monooxygenase, partial [Lutibacter sp.]|nr:phenylalanine 4-monooxygenase [Lutibacter sp.]
VTHNDTILFQPAWGIYDMAVGKDIISAHAGSASVNSFKNLGEVSATKTHKISYSEEEIKLHKMYQEIAEMRKSGNVDLLRLALVFEKLKTNFSADWLLPIEMYELVYPLNTAIETEILAYLTQLQKNKKHEQLIANGIRLISK